MEKKICIYTKYDFEGNYNVRDIIIVISKIPIQSTDLIFSIKKKQQHYP